MEMLLGLRPHRVVGRLERQQELGQLRRDFGGQQRHLGSLVESTRHAGDDARLTVLLEDVVS